MFILYTALVITGVAFYIATLIHFTSWLSEKFGNYLGFVLPVILCSLGICLPIVTLIYCLGGIR